MKVLTFPGNPGRRERFGAPFRAASGGSGFRVSLRSGQ